MITLYPDQSACVDAIRAAMRRSRRMLFCLSTGGGKTVIFSYIAARVAERGKRIVILVHRDELVGQVSRTLSAFDVPHGIIAAGYPTSSQPVQVASVFSLVRRLPTLPVPDLIICDEAHHCVAGNTWGKVMAAWETALLLGVTATPCRSDQKGLGDVFGELIQGPPMADLIANRRLSPYRIFAPSTPDMAGIHRRGGDYAKDELSALVDKPSITGDAVTHYRRLMNGAPSVAFCVSIEHTRHVAEQFRAAGYTAESVDGTMEREERRGIMADFAAGRINVLTSADLISEGLDVHGIIGAILLRPTQSLGLYMQQVGRALRYVEGKTAIILDHAGNCQRHGLPDDVRAWSLDGTPIRTAAADPDDVAIKQCPAPCFAWVRSTVMTCPVCGHAWTPQPRQITQVAGDLAEVDLTAQRKQSRIEQGRAADVAALMRLGHSEARARIIIAARTEKEALRRQVIERTGLPMRQVWAMKPKEMKALLV